MKMHLGVQRASEDPWREAMTAPLTREEWVSRIRAALEVTGGRRGLAARMRDIHPITIRRYIGPKQAGQVDLALPRLYGKGASG